MKNLILIFCTLILLTSCATNDLPPEPNVPGAAGNYYRYIDDWATESQTFNIENPLLINNSEYFSCDSGEEVPLVVSTSGDDYIYKYFYIWDESYQEWDRYEFPENTLGSSNWVSSKARFKVYATCDDLVKLADDNDELFVVGYSCSRSGDSWDCHGNKWQLDIGQVTKNEKICVDSDGGIYPKIPSIIGTDNWNGTETCNDDMIQENYCNENSDLIAKPILCEYGCQDGACIDLPVDPNGPGVNLVEVSKYAIKGYAPSYAEGWSPKYATLEPNAKWGSWTQGTAWCKDGTDTKGLLETYFDEPMTPNSIVIYFAGTDLLKHVGYRTDVPPPEYISKNYKVEILIGSSDSVETISSFNSSSKWVDVTSSIQNFGLSGSTVSMELVLNRQYSDVKGVRLTVYPGVSGCVDAVEMKGLGTPSKIACYSNKDCEPPSRTYCSGDSVCTDDNYYYCENPGTSQSRCADLHVDYKACPLDDENCIIPSKCQICENGCNDGKCVVDNYIIPNNCISWYNGCNTCSVNKGELVACTERYCEQYDEPKCLLDNIGTELFLTLNEPMGFDLGGQNFTLEIVGASSDSSSSGSMILDVNGVRKTLLEDETAIINGLDLYVRNLFVTNIPTLSASANLVISARNETYSN